MSESTTTTTATTEQQEQQQDQQQEQQQEVAATNEEQTSPSVAAQQQEDNEDTTDSNNNKNETDNNKDDAVEVPATTSTTTTTTTAVVTTAAASDEPKSPDSNENGTTSPPSTNNNNNSNDNNNNNKTSNNNNNQKSASKRRESSTEMPHHMNTNNVGAKLAARHHKQMMESLDRNNRATASALRTIDDITVKKKDYSSIHRAIEDLNRQEEQLFVEIPAKIGHTRIPKVDKKGAFVFTSPSKNNSSRDSNDNNETPARNNNDNNNSNGGGALVAAGATSPTSSFKIEPSPTPQKAKKKIQTMEDAGVEKLVPLPLRNVVPKSEIVSPSRFQNIPQPTENKKDALREKKQQELEKMIGSKPGEKGPARTTGNGFKPEQKPVKKVPKDFAPSCYEKRPSHWEEPEKATRKVLPPGMRFRSSPSVLKGSNSKEEECADGEEGEEYEVQEETQQAEE